MAFEKGTSRKICRGFSSIHARTAISATVRAGKLSLIFGTNPVSERTFLQECKPMMLLAMVIGPLILLGILNLMPKSEEYYWYEYLREKRGR